VSHQDTVKPTIFCIKMWEPTGNLTLNGAVFHLYITNSGGFLPTAVTASIINYSFSFPLS